MKYGMMLLVLLLVAGCSKNRNGDWVVAQQSVMNQLDRACAERDSLARIVSRVRDLSTTEDVFRLAAVKDSLETEIRIFKGHKKWDLLGLGWWLEHRDPGGQYARWEVRHSVDGYHRDHQAAANLVRLWQEGINIRLELIRMEGPAE